MFIQSLKYDYQTAGILVEYVTKSEAREMMAKLSRSIFRKGELEQFEGLVTGITSVENYLVVATDAGADELDQIIEFIKDEADPDQEDENDYEQKETNEDFSMGVSGPTGLNQGIPHGGPGKGCLPKPLYNPKAKAVPAKEKDDKDTEENLKNLRSAKKLLKNEGFALVRENAVPEYFCRHPFTVEDLENYLHDEDGFEWDEVDCLIDNNRDMILNKLEQGMSPERISADLDDSCLDAVK